MSGKLVPLILACALAVAAVVLVVGGLVAVAFVLRAMFRGVNKSPRISTTPTGYRLGGRLGSVDEWNGSAGRATRCKAFHSTFYGVIGSANQQTCLLQTVRCAQEWLNELPHEVVIRSVDLAQSSSTSHVVLWYEVHSGEPSTAIEVELFQLHYTGLIGSGSIVPTLEETLSRACDWIRDHGEVEVLDVSSAQSRTSSTVAVWYRPSVVSRRQPKRVKLSAPAQG